MLLSSLQRRFAVLALLVLVVLGGMIVYSQNQAGKITREAIQSVAEVRQLERQVNELRDSLQALEQRVYQRTVVSYSDNESVEQQIHHYLEQLNQQINTLFTISSRDNNWEEAAKHDPDSFAALAFELKQQVRKLKRYIDYYNMIASDTRLRFPFSRTLNERLLPLSNDFVVAVNTALQEINSAGETSNNKSLNRLFTDLRYNWVQQISIFRMFVLSRSGMFDTPRSAMEVTLNDRSMFWDNIGDLLEQLYELDQEGELPFETGFAIERMREIYIEYDNHFSEIKPTLMSDEWRIDHLFLNEKLQPEFSTTTQIVSRISEKIKNHSTKIIDKTHAVADRINLMIWLSGAIFLILVLAGYLMFEHLIRRPVRIMADAMNAEARGESFYPVMSADIEETRLLVDAFHNMQEQVHSRQARLETILDNAAEGVITMDRNGMIENFNQAAEGLFGYSAVEIIGRNVNILFPRDARRPPDSYISRFCQGDIRPTDSEIDTTGRHKNGMTFPVSLKISEMNIGGQLLYTALVDDVSERITMISNLRHLAEHDSLTGLHNRYFFLQEVERIAQRATRGKHEDVALLYIDMDNFKYVNDTMGHMAGDKLLIEVAAMLKTRSRETDLVARVGGDEFSVILYDVERDTALKTADAFRKKLEQYHFSFEGRLADVGCSIGVAMVEQGISKDELMARADLSCNAAKRSGRNKVHIYTEADKQNLENISDDMGWVRRIKQALRNNRFMFVVQPIMQAGTHEINRCEVLLRMLDDEGRFIMPSGFIPPAERFGLMPDIDRWVVNHAIDYLASGDSETFNLSINLSALSFDDEGMINFITDKIRQTGIEATRLTFEITETVAMANLELTVTFLEKLRNLGCRTALDDFGVGYSSFAYLKELPVDYVKIDGSFVRDLENNELHQAIVKSMNDICRAMDKLTVAEFVETGATMHILEQMGIDCLQGYYIGRPEIPDFEKQRMTH